MSQGNVETAKRAVDAFNRRDVEGFFSLAASDFEWFPAMVGAVDLDHGEALRAAGLEG